MRLRLRQSLNSGQNESRREGLATGIIKEMRKAVRIIMIRDNQLLVMNRNKFGHQYYALVGGGIDVGETAEQALVREVKEETSLNLSRFRPVFIEEAGVPFGTQYVYICDYPGGEAALPDDSPEAQINKLGSNLYKVEWLPLDKLKDSAFLSETLKLAIMNGLKNGWPEQPINIHPRPVQRRSKMARKRDRAFALTMAVFLLYHGHLALVSTFLAATFLP